MPKHIKPTDDELNENIEKSLDDLEKMDDDKPEPKADIQPDTEKEDGKAEGKQEQEPEPEKEESVEEEQEDYKKKFVESSREAQILHSKNKKVNDAFDKVMTIPEATEEDLKKEYPDWELMGEFEKKIAKDSLTNSRKFEAIAEISKDNKDLEKWHDEVDKYVDNPKTLVDNPKLEGRQEEFKLFASKPTRRNVDFEDLTKAFLYDLDLKRPKHKGRMFESGTGGANDKGKPKDGKITVTEARQLRNNDYNKYKELVKAGKIDLSDL